MLRFLWTRVHGMSQLILNICVWFSTTLFEPKIQQKNTNWCVILIMNSNVSIVICFGWIPIAPKSTVSLLEYYFPSKWSDWRMNERFMMIWESTHTHTYTSRFILLKNFFAGADNVLNNSFCRFFSISFRCIEQTFKIEYENFFRFGVCVSFTWSKSNAAHSRWSKHAFAIASNADTARPNGNTRENENKMKWIKNKSKRGREGDRERDRELREKRKSYSGMCIFGFYIRSQRKKQKRRKKKMFLYEVYE